MEKYFCVVMIAVCLLLGTAGCGGEDNVQQGAEAAEDESAFDLTIFDKNSERHAFDDRIAQEIMRRTGVKIQVIDSTADASKREELMFTYQDYPDMIKVDLDAITKYQDAGYLVDLEPYLDSLPSVKEMYGDMLDRMRTKEGELYYLGNWYGEDLDAVNGFLIRYDYLAELAGKERADSDEPFTQEEFLKLLQAFSERYPEIDGKKTIPFTICQDFDYLGSIQGMFGMKTYYEKGGRLYHIARDPKYLDMISFLNRMYREGWMDKEWVVNRTGLFEDKLISGRVFAVACAYWDLANVNEVLREQGDGSGFFACYKVVGEGTDASETTYGGRNSLGWDAIAVTDHCQNMEAALKVINFLASEEGQYLMLWGIEGEDWDFVDGVRTPRKENLELFARDATEAVEKTGIRRWIWFIKNGKGSDGQPYDVLVQHRLTQDTAIANRRMAGDYWDTSQYLGLEPLSGTKESLMWTNIENIYDRTFPRMINADSEQAMLELYEHLIEDMEAEGLKDVETVWTQNYENWMERWRE